MSDFPGQIVEMIDTSTAIVNESNLSQTTAKFQYEEQKGDSQIETRLVGETGLGFVRRDLGVKNEEEQGLLKFIVIKNDKSIESMRHLIDLKNIIAKQLPKMPRNYIVKLMMDRQHEAMVIMRHQAGKRPQIIGGCVFRPFRSQRFAEIVFLAIMTSEQVKGLGTRLMNKLKSHAQKEGLQYFLTYADNLAIEFFKKQGFNQKGYMAEPRWKGYIKDYSGSTMMQCQIHTDIDYVNLSDALRLQKDAIIEKIKSIISQKVQEGLNFENGQKAYEFENIPGLIEAGWNKEAYEVAKAGEERTFQEQCQKILKFLLDHESSRVFRKPVDPKKVPDYHQIIREPMDLEKIQKNLNESLYHTVDQFKKDLIKIFDNARQYNNPETIYYKYANQLQALVKPMLDRMRENNSFEKDIKMLQNVTGQQSLQVNSQSMGDVNMESYDQGDNSSNVPENPSVHGSAMQEGKRRSAIDSKTRKMKR